MNLNEFELNFLSKNKARKILFKTVKQFSFDLQKKKSNSS